MMCLRVQSKHEITPAAEKEEDLKIISHPNESDSLMRDKLQVTLYQEAFFPLCVSVRNRQHYD